MNIRILPLLPLFSAFLLLQIGLSTFFSRSIPAQERDQNPLAKLQGLDEDRLKAGNIALFDGATLYGLAPREKGNWQVVDGLLVGNGTAEMPAQIRPDIQFGHFALRIQYSATEESAMYLHSRPRPEPSEVGKSCFGVTLPASDVIVTGEIQIDAEGMKTNFPTTSVEGSAKTHGRGYIVIETSGKIEIKELSLRPLGQQSLFNGKTLAGWKSREDLTGEYFVEDGNMRIRGGRGQLEHEKPLGDFTLQLEAKVANDEENSGLFFRCIPGDVMMGYESQICHAHEEGDRTVPKDCGTGGIFRRQNARVVLPDGDDWFYKTIIAEGPNIAVWVNGILVTRWTDDRKPDENPRRGYRAEAGTIMLQAHDPTTNFTLRKIEATELPKRK
jgi:hypothetical protein